MKKLFSVLILAIISLSLVNAQSSNAKKNIAGDWKFEAPYAPEGYSDGKITVGLADGNYSAAITFTGSTYKITGEKVKYENDTLTFFVYIEGESVSVQMKAEAGSKMTGKAIYSEGEIPITANKVTK